MKTTKEYPATHSMSTAWFIADADGNVGAFDFNENGPIPWHIKPDLSIDGLIEEEFVYFDEEGFPTFEMTHEQLNCALDSMKPLDKDFDFMDSIVEIDISKESEFRQLIGKKDAVCLSRALGIYIIIFFQNKDKPLMDLLCSMISRYKYFSICNNDIFVKEQQKIVYEHYPDDYLPFYLYQQPYWIEEPMQRTIVPKHPFKVEQLPESVRKKLLHIPIKFSDYPQLQIAEFVPSRIDDRADEIINDIPFCCQNRMVK